MKINILVLLTIFSALFASDILLDEKFTSLDRWEDFNFAKIERKSKYEIIKTDDENFILQAISDNSASGLILKEKFNVYEYPIISWKWKVDNLYKNGDVMKKKGDDSPLRIYVIFEDNPQKASFIENIQYRTLKLLYGKYPPHSSLSYIWASKNYQRQTIIVSPYTSKAKMVILQSGKDKVGEWMEETANILSDYRKAFGVNPPATASLAIMNDSDNTGEKSISYLDYIVLRKE